MNRSRLLMIGGLALAVGLLVSFTVYDRLRNVAGSNSNAAGVPVVVAADDIQVGAKLEAHDVRVVNLPPSAVPPAIPFTPIRDDVATVPGAIPGGGARPPHPGFLYRVLRSLYRAAPPVITHSSWVGSVRARFMRALGGKRTSY